MVMLVRILETVLYMSRWLLAPVYLGLVLGLIAIGIKFYQEAYHLLHDILVKPESNLILIVLSLVDMTLVGGLIVMVMLSGYENFISRLDITGNELGWLGKLD